MSIIVAMDDVKPDQVFRRNPPSVAGISTTFFGRPNGNAYLTADTPDSPEAFLSQYDPGPTYSSAHFHVADEFQIIIDGTGKFGRHDVAPYFVHFARAFTPYGPLQSNAKTGWAFLTCRAHPGGRSQRSAQDQLKQIPNRRPWQIMKKITFAAQGPGISLLTDPEIKDEQGLFACALTMAPRTRTTAPDPSGGEGQFVVVVKGSLKYGNREHKALTVAFVKPEEDALQIHAGAQGLQGLILNLPRVKARAAAPKSPSVAAGFKKWQCVLCAFAYDEALGMPVDGIPAGTRWKDVPESWSCPDCSASKSDFQMVEVV